MHPVFKDGSNKNGLTLKSSTIRGKVVRSGLCACSISPLPRQVRACFLTGFLLVIISAMAIKKYWMQSKVYLFIAAISRYTDFITLHSFREKFIVGSFAARMFESHSIIIISDPLEAVTQAIKPDMQFNKL